ncbi:hypothetical protein [Nocardia camponoti]|uniref:Uncharacterized protein n=1 Tax=Nocardia camponoti TaxID=1616106 RepID=A0A917QUH0_9NOCA|nr:hypothetical protein [Nocardia camponoti]GGK68983.1 hypothetical protein GCM10011591_46380 [Nocardia camponoti]
MNQPVETPVMGLPRDEMMRLALATRTMATLLREIRERRGRAAWDDTNNAARKRAAATRPMIGRFSHADLGEWNRLGPEAIRSELHEDSGMTIRVGPLSNGRFGVQAGWADHHAETVAGSKDMADRITDWLRANASHEAVDVMHLSSEEIHNTGTAGPARHQRRDQQRSDFTTAREWLHSTDPDRAADWERSYAATDSTVNRDLDEKQLIAEWSKATGGGTLTPFQQARKWVRENRPEYHADWEQRYAAADSRHDKRGDEAELVRFWIKEKAAETNSAQGPESAEKNSSTKPRPLADRLRGKVPDRVLDDARWETAEQQFASLVAEGVDPDHLVAAVAAIDFDSGKVRAPSGFAAWVMRDAAKNGRARSTTSEDEARRDVAQEWLDSADASSPFDRARAATLVGEIDDEFDAALAKKFPGILDSEEPAASSVPDTEVAESSEQEHHDENTVFVVDQDGEVIEVPFVAAEPAAAEATQPADASASADHEPGEEKTAAAAAGASAEAAQAVMTPPSASKGKSQQHSRTRRRGAAPVNEPTQHRTRGHSH